MASSAPIEVHVELDRGPAVSGSLHFNARRGVESSTFGYDPTFIARPDAYGLEPQLPLTTGGHSTTGLFGCFDDSAPDRWGRILIKRRESQRAREEERAERTVMESDYLLGVNDETRQGAVRFRRAGDREFLSPAGRAVPTIVTLPALLDAADRVADDDEAALRLLLDAGSASLGGARPKTAVTHQGSLWIAKFPHQSDEWDVMAWEMTALDLAARAGIMTPERMLVKVADRHVLLLKRFDRVAGVRVGYISARTLLESPEADRVDYGDLAEALEVTTKCASLDLQELWRRMVLSIMLNNTDDHLRNHGLLRVDGGWQLSPVFDVNPDPDPAKHRVTSVMGESRGAAQLEAAREIAGEFRLEPSRAEQTMDDLRAAVSSWREVAAGNGIERRGCDAMAAAFSLGS